MNPHQQNSPPDLGGAGGLGSRSGLSIKEPSVNFDYEACDAETTNLERLADDGAALLRGLGCPAREALAYADALVAWMGAKERVAARSVTTALVTGGEATRPPPNFSASSFLSTASHARAEPGELAAWLTERDVRAWQVRRAALNALLGNDGRSFAEVAKSIGVTRAALSLVYTKLARQLGFATTFRRAETRRRNAEAAARRWARTTRRKNAQGA